MPVTAEEFEHVKAEIVEMICGGLDVPSRSVIWLNPWPMTESPLVKRLIWSGLLAGRRRRCRVLVAKRALT